MFDDIQRQYRNEESVSVIWLCAITVLAVFPFAIFRLVQQEWLIGIIDLVAAFLAFILLVFVYRTKRPEVPAIIFSLTFLIVAWLTVSINGVSTIYWSYPSIVVAFYILSSRVALFLVSIFFVTMLVTLWLVAEYFEFATNVVTLFVTATVSYVFAANRFEQRKQLYLLSINDPLTSAGNRRALDDKLEQVISLHLREKVPASLIMLDLDFFKKINDTHGHRAGDEALKKLVSFIRSIIRKHDSVFRYGGEEFIVVAEFSDLAEAEQLAQKIQSSIQQEEFLPGETMTVSIGVAEFNGEGNQDDWITRADRALYDAKEAGRNRVVTYRN